MKFRVDVRRRGSGRSSLWLTNSSLSLRNSSHLLLPPPPTSKKLLPPYAASSPSLRRLLPLRLRNTVSGALTVFICYLCTIDFTFSQAKKIMMPDIGEFLIVCKQLMGRTANCFFFFSSFSRTLFFFLVENLFVQQFDLCWTETSCQSSLAFPVQWGHDTKANTKWAGHTVRRHDESRRQSHSQSFITSTFQLLNCRQTVAQLLRLHACGFLITSCNSHQDYFCITTVAAPTSQKIYAGLFFLHPNHLSHFISSNSQRKKERKKIVNGRKISWNFSQKT